MMSRLFSATALIALTLFSGCYTFREGPHKFDGMFEEHPAAYQNGSDANINSEKMTLFVKLENRGKYPIRLASIPRTSGKQRPGLYIHATLLNPNEVFSQSELDVDRGVRAGRVLKPFANAAQDPLFDSYQHEVRDFARLGSKYLRLDPDLALNALTIHGNEAMVYVQLPVNWKNVQWGNDLVKQYNLKLELTFRYLDRKKQWWALDETIKHSMNVYLHRARRNATSTIHSGSGPAEGTFKPTAKQ